MMAVMGFLIAFIVSGFTLCLGFQCYLNSSTTFSSSTYTTLKQAFIGCELACSAAYIILSITYIIFFIKCYKKLPRIHPVVQRLPTQTVIENRQLSSLSRTSRPYSMSVISDNQQDINERISALSSSTATYSGAQKICPNCRHVSPYIPLGNIVECPSCKYQSPLVEHAQQW
jgi:hypothetical protein